MYDTQWKCDINKNVSKIILLMKEHNKKAKNVDISILLWFYPPLPPLPGDFCVGLGVQASKETARKFKFNKPFSLSLLDLYWCLVLGKGSLKTEPNYFSSLALNIFKVLHRTGI